MFFRITAEYFEFTHYFEYWFIRHDVIIWLPTSPYQKHSVAAREQQSALQRTDDAAGEHHRARLLRLVCCRAVAARTAAQRSGALFHLQRFADDAALQWGGHLDRFQGANSAVPRPGNVNEYSIFTRAFIMHVDGQSQQHTTKWSITGSWNSRETPR